MNQMVGIRFWLAAGGAGFMALAPPANRSTDTLLTRALVKLPGETINSLWQKTVEAKCRNQFALAEHVAPEHAQLALLRGAAFSKKAHKEAICAKYYWQILGQSAQGEDFVRDRAQAGLNHLLNYGYAVLLSSVLQKLFGVGLDPTFGISHLPRERSTPLAYDLMEPFRPCVDWRVVQWVRRLPEGAAREVSKEFRRWVTGFAIERVEPTGK